MKVELKEILDMASRGVRLAYKVKYPESTEPFEAWLSRLMETPGGVLPPIYEALMAASLEVFPEEDRRDVICASMMSVFSMSSWFDPSADEIFPGWERLEVDFDKVFGSAQPSRKALQLADGTEEPFRRATID